MGVTLVNQAIDKPRLQEVFSLPFQFYFTDLEHRLVCLNQKMVEVGGFISEKDILGKTALDIAKKDTALPLIKNNAEIINQRSTKIVDEFMIRNDNILIESVSIKIPWYDHGKLVGIFGCSMILDSIHMYSKALSQLAQVGLLKFVSIPLNQIRDKNFFTRREQDIAYFLIRGNTAKEIATRLCLSRRTVEQYLVSMKIKTKSKTKSELIEKLID